jgi:hypothetical protein
MKLSWAATSVLALALLAPAASSCADDGLKKTDPLEQNGDAAATRIALLNATQQAPGDAPALGAYAAFLDRYHDPEARAAYKKWLAALPKDSPQANDVRRRLIALDLISGANDEAAATLNDYQAAGGKGLSLFSGNPSSGNSSSGNPAPSTTASTGYIEIPGPIRSFARMAAIPSDADADDVLLALARNVVTNGYQASRSNEVLEPTEYMKLLIRYVSQARELDKLAGPRKVIKIDTCESADTGELLRVVGFRIRGGCGSDVVLETVNAARAFLTTDSGFPMARLEQDLRTNRPFSYDYHPSRVPVLYGPDYWITAKEKGNGDFLDAFLADPSLCRFYLGMAKLDLPTAAGLKANVPMPRLRAYAHVLDFFGGMFEIRDGRAVVPGGQRSAGAWAELVGESPEKGPQFFEKLLAKDDGWLASLYDALARINGPVQAYLTEPAHMKRYYAAVRGLVTSPGPARPVFRANADMMLLTTRLRLETDGRPHIPGGIPIWRSLFVNHPHEKYDAKLTRSAAFWNDPDDVIESLFALSRKSVDNEPLKIFMSVSDLDRYRTTALAPATVDRLARDFRLYGAQYQIFSDSPSLSDATIVHYLDTMDSVDRIRDMLLRADTSGSLQALTGLWQIFCRQGSLPLRDSDKALSAILAPFGNIHSDSDLFQAARAGVRTLLAATGTPEGTPMQERIAQERMLELLAGGNSAADTDTRDQIVKEMQRALDAQRIVTLTSLFDIAANLEKASAGQPADMPAAQKLAARISEIQLPRPPLTASERSVLSLGYWSEKHIENERRLNLRAMLDHSGHDADRMRDVEGALAPLLRDTLVAFNYVHYAPPAAQILYTNPLFVRDHDFVGMNGNANPWKQTQVFGTGWPSNGGGRLVGSLSSLPYALAEAEQNFLIPTKTQALIWSDLVPQMIVSATIPRWWDVTALQMHWVALHMNTGESLLAESALDPRLRIAVLDALRQQVSPNRISKTQALLEAGNVRAAIEQLTPIEVYLLACSLQSSLQASPRIAAWPASVEIAAIAARHPSEVSDDAVSRAFGTPKPTLANSYRAEILKLRTFPTLMGYSSRIMAESWESNTLFWASVADQIHLPPAQLNIMIPEWTRKVVENIFASHLEDWPALLKSLRTVGDDVRAGSAVGVTPEVTPAGGA